MATLLLAVLTTVGSILATLLSAPLSPFITRFLPRPLALARNIFEADSGESTKAPSPTWVRLTVFRLVGIVPWSGINVACGVLGVSLRDCFLGTFIGAIPWTAVTCQVGAHSRSRDPNTTTDTRFHRSETYCRRWHLRLPRILKPFHLSSLHHSSFPSWCFCHFCLLHLFLAVTISKLGCRKQPHPSVLKNTQRIAYRVGCGSQSGAQKFACRLGHELGTIPNLSWKHLRPRRCKFYDRRMSSRGFIHLFALTSQHSSRRINSIFASFTHLTLMKGHVDLVVVVYTLLI